MFTSIWQLNDSLQRNVEDILHCYFLATHYDQTWYKAWHTWALANFEVIGHLESLPSVNKNGLVAHVVQAVEGKFLNAHAAEPPKSVLLGFFRSIALRNREALQDTLRLLTLWFKFGELQEVSHAIGSGFNAVEVDTWLDVLPQVRVFTQVLNDGLTSFRLSRAFKHRIPTFDAISIVF